MIPSAEKPRFVLSRTGKAGLHAAGNVADRELDRAVSETTVAGSRSCRACHRGDYEQWRRRPTPTPGRRSSARGAGGFFLPAVSHAGLRPAGRVPVAAEDSGARQLGCEDCDGPSQSHVANPRAHMAYFAAAASRCTACHDARNSPRFDFEQYRPRIRHGRTEKPADGPARPMTNSGKSVGPATKSVRPATKPVQPVKVTTEKDHRGASAIPAERDDHASDTEP